MRWIVVFLFLYFIPLIVLFKNYNNIKRSFIYASMYITLVTTIVITNIYISGLNKIKESMYYQNYSFGKEYTEEKIINENKPVQDTSEIAKLEEIKVNAKNDSNNIVSENKENDNKEVVNFDSKKSDKELIYEFKKEIYEIELKALIPMRECIPYTKNIVENIKKLDKVKQDLEYASDMCTEVISIYTTMDIPQLSNDEYTKMLIDARNDVKTAYENGADRVELNSALYLGGLTPSLANLICAKEQCEIPVVAMVRPRGGGFCYSAEEYQTMILDTKLLLEHGADGIAFGFLKEDQTLDTERTKEVIYLIHEQGREAVFHRAFDCVADQKKTIEQLIGLGADRILTSGGAPDVWSGRERLKQLQKEYGSEIEILAGSGVNENNVRELMTYTGVHQVHSSCRVWKKDITTSNEYVDFSYAGIQEKNQYEVVDAAKVHRLAELC